MMTMTLNVIVDLGESGIDLDAGMITGFPSLALVRAQGTPIGTETSGSEIMVTGCSPVTVIVAMTDIAVSFLGAESARVLLILRMIDLGPGISISLGPDWMSHPNLFSLR